MLKNTKMSRNGQSAAKTLNRNIRVRFRDYRNHRLFWKRVEYIRLKIFWKK